MDEKDRLLEAAIGGTVIQSDWEAIHIETKDGTVIVVRPDADGYGWYGFRAYERED